MYNKKYFSSEKQYAQLSCMNDVSALENIGQKVSEDMKWGQHNI